MRGNLADVRDLPGKEPIVFGRVKLIERGQPEESFGSSFAVHIIPDAPPEPIPTYVYVVKKDGSFY